MQKSEKFFIFSWKELFVLGLLVVTALGFCFTLGLHYGKQIRGDEQVVEAPAPKVEGGHESTPPRAVLDQGAQYVDQATKEAIDGATEKAAADSGIKLDHPKPVELPAEKTVHPPMALPTAVTHPPVAEEEAEEEEEEVAEKPAAPAEIFAVQLGSYPNQQAARKKMGVFTKRGLKTEVRTAKVNGETRYRVVLSGFKSRKAAEAKGKELVSKRKVESFVVISSASPR
jgi:cell division protein FtsN